MGRPKVPLIRRPEVVAAALDIIDEDGADGLSMRRLGSRLGVNAASLYYHFANKEEILDEIIQTILTGAAVVEEDAEGWQDALLDATLRTVSVLRAHPRVMAVVVTRADGRFALDAHARAVKLMVDSGVPVGMIASLIDSMQALWVGLLNLELMEDGSAHELKPSDSAVLKDVIKKNSVSSNQRMEFALRAFLAGWEAQILPMAESLSRSRTRARPAPKLVKQT